MSDVRFWYPEAQQWFDNAIPSPDGAPEGWGSQECNDSIREIYASIRRQFQEGGWLDWNHSYSYVSANSFTATDTGVTDPPTQDLTSVYQVNRRIRTITSGGTAYGVITESTNNAGVQTVTFTLDSGVFGSTISSIAVGQDANSVPGTQFAGSVTWSTIDTDPQTTAALFEYVETEKDWYLPGEWAQATARYDYNLLVKNDQDKTDQSEAMAVFEAYSSAVAPGFEKTAVMAAGHAQTGATADFSAMQAYLRIEDLYGGTNAIAHRIRVNNQNVTTPVGTALSIEQANGGGGTALGIDISGVDKAMSIVKQNGSTAPFITMEQDGNLEFEFRYNGQFRADNLVESGGVIRADNYMAAGERLILGDSIGDVTSLSHYFIRSPNDVNLPAWRDGTDILDLIVSGSTQTSVFNGQTEFYDTVLFLKPPPANPDDVEYIAEFRGDVYIGFTDAAGGATNQEDHNLFVRDDIYVGDKIFIGEGPQNEIPTQQYFLERATGDNDTLYWVKLQSGTANPEPPATAGSIRASKDIVADRQIFLNARDNQDYFLFIDGSGNLVASCEGNTTVLATP